MRRNKLLVLVHFVWATQDRIPLITPNIERRLYRYITSVCQQHGCPAIAVGGMPDHIHLLVSLSNTISLSELMKEIKGSSSRFVSEQLHPEGWFAWQPNYGAFSVSPADKEKVIGYILNQKQHHAHGSIWKNAEEDCEHFEDGNTWQ
ncbi:MAG TPA: IS200/IS605 family transposase [Chthonomonadaceae bacterium]|nr:IS200/IS605 family transposase [Chthonomonadaceae bacterium]